MRHSLAKQHDYVKPGAGQKRKFLWDQDSTDPYPGGKLSRNARHHTQHTS